MQNEKFSLPKSPSITGHSLLIGGSPPSTLQYLSNYVYTTLSPCHYHKVYSSIHHNCVSQEMKKSKQWESNSNLFFSSSRAILVFHYFISILQSLVPTRSFFTFFYIKFCFSFNVWNYYMWSIFANPKLNEAAMGNSHAKKRDTQFSRNVVEGRVPSPKNKTLSPSPSLEPPLPREPPPLAAMSLNKGSGKLSAKEKYALIPDNFTTLEQVCSAYSSSFCYWIL